MSNFLLTAQGSRDRRAHRRRGGPRARARASASDLPVELVPYPGPGVLADDAGKSKWDVGFLGAEPQRANEIDFTPAYVEIEATYLLPPGSPLKSVAEVDRKGVRIAVPERSAYELWLTRNIKNAELVRIKGADDAFKQFVDGQAGRARRLAAAARHGPREAARLAHTRWQFHRRPAGRRHAERPSRGVRATSSEFIEDIKATGLVAKTIEKNNVRGLTVAPKA